MAEDVPLVTVRRVTKETDSPAYAYRVEWPREGLVYESEPMHPVALNIRARDAFTERARIMKEEDVQKRRRALFVELHAGSLMAERMSEQRTFTEEDEEEMRLELSRRREREEMERVSDRSDP